MNTVAKRSKRSTRVKLTTMAAFGIGAALSACSGAEAPDANPVVAQGEEREDIEVFENVFACAKSTGKTVEECEAMREEAAKVAAKEAPRYQALQDCEADYGEGRCVKEEASSGRRSHFSAFVVGWYSSKSRGSGPLFNSKSGGYQTANGSRIGYAGAPGKYYASNRALERAKSVPKVKPASAMAKAAGFGRSANAAKFARSGKSSGVRSKGG